MINLRYASLKFCAVNITSFTNSKNSILTALTACLNNYLRVSTITIFIPKQCGHLWKSQASVIASIFSWPSSINGDKEVLEIPRPQNPGPCLAAS